MNIHAKRITEGGKDYVRIPAKEYEKLLKMIADAEGLRDAGIAMKRLQEGEATLSASFVHSLIGATPGEKIALWRKYRGLTRDALASAVGITGASVTMIETGKRKGTIAALKKFASALECGVEDLI